MRLLLPFLLGALLAAGPAGAADCNEPGAAFVEQVLGSIRNWHRVNRGNADSAASDRDYRRYDLLKRKIGAGRHVNARDCYGISLLNNVLEQQPSPRTLAFARALLRAGADPNRPSADGYPPLLAFIGHLAEFRARGVDSKLVVDTLETLLAAGADPQVRLDDGDQVITVLDGLIDAREPAWAAPLVARMKPAFVRELLADYEDELRRAPAIRALLKQRLQPPEKRPTEKNAEKTHGKKDRSPQTPPEPAQSRQDTK